MKKLRLVVVDDHSLFRRGLIGLLADMAEFVVVGEAANGDDALGVVKNAKPDVVLLDVNMPGLNGVNVVTQLRKTEKCRILMLTISKNDNDLFGAINAGADGYLLKSAEPEELRKAILTVAEGKSVLSAEVTRQVMRAVANTMVTMRERVLSERELDVLACLAKGLTTMQISEQLFISENTVKTHIRHILEKLESANRAEAVSRAIQLGLINLP